MKITLNKKSLKQLNQDAYLDSALTPKAAGGMYASSPLVPGCISYNGLSCPTSPYDKNCR
ncbi:hypothetical protein ACSLBF_16750 [Pseudoalteromonas sp. T1lg65]|uniref:hypothetical protein n=1 Tax=Pseudoalteromonas sp. T1lg65 TaxID=2077101 RepID=UPI003F7A9902